MEKRVSPWKRMVLNTSQKPVMEWMNECMHAVWGLFWGA